MLYAKRLQIWCTGRIKRRKLMVLFTLAILSLILLQMQTTEVRKTLKHNSLVSKSNKVGYQRMKNSHRKIILLYTPIFGNLWHDIPKDAPENFLSTLNCKIRNCIVTYDKNLLHKTDVVLFHASDMPHADQLHQLRSRCPQRQLWGYLTDESPENTLDLSPLHGLFNLTLTYRKDSDVWLPYARYLPLTDGEDRPDININYAENKRPGATWIVSHCGLLRQKYALKLQEMYPVFVGGKCKSIFRNKIHCQKDCFKHIRGYKFYLAFENGFCQDYITEKYWFNALLTDSIPIVMGAGPYDNGEHGAIPRSYINVENFKTIEQLANYLHYLDQNDTAYNKYFEWKQKYKQDSHFFSKFVLCSVCDIVNQNHYSVKIVNLTSFWGRVQSCSCREKKVMEIIARE